jgi:serine/tyrosine/threonine adenylyltransferase
MPVSFSKLNFDCRYVKALPADDERENYPRQVYHSAYSYVVPKKSSKPNLIILSNDCATQLGITNTNADSTEFANTLCGNTLLSGMKPYAMCYGGHQFGYWAGQLGDGRAINLGELKTPDNGYKTLQLKGAGPTPYSRSADGFAVLRSSIREFLCSEAMFYLGIPTTRALSLCLTGDLVLRDMFYDGHARHEFGAVVCRISSSFTRFGTFQLPASRGDVELLKSLVDTCITLDFSHLLNDKQEINEAIYLSWFSEVCDRTCELMVHWMRVGFVHGVMNTDNMSIIGETIDFGPYGWLEGYDPLWTPNTTDASHHRYCFGRQPTIALWNLNRLAQAVSPLVCDISQFKEYLKISVRHLEVQIQKMQANKLGLEAYIPKTDQLLLDQLLEVLQMHEIDFTIFYRNLSRVCKDTNLEKSTEDALIRPILDAYYLPKQLSKEAKSSMAQWLRNYITRLNKDIGSDSDRSKKMNRVNPKYILRNYLAQLAIGKAEKEDFSDVNELFEVMKHPYDEQSDKETYAKKRPEWARSKAGCSMLSCSS